MDTNGYSQQDYFSRYGFAYPVRHSDAKTASKCIIDIMTKHAYLAQKIKSDKGSAFIAKITTEVAKVLGIEMKEATAKHHQTIGALERAHTSVKATLKMETGERRSMWHHYVKLAVVNYNTSYHSSLGCEPSRVFHGRVPHNLLDFKLGVRPNQRPKPTTDSLNRYNARQTKFIKQQERI